MYRIALCDDEEKVLEQMEQFLASYQWEGRRKQKPEYKTERFLNAEALLWKVREEGYSPDLLLLDIYMSGKSGVEAAEEMRRLGMGMPIIFLTTSTEHALKAYEVDAIQYLVKPFGQDRFFHAMDSAMGQIGKKDIPLIFKSEGRMWQIQPDDIIYCESQKNYQILYLATEKYRVRMTAGKLWEMLEKFPQFARCGRSYILNMAHILSIEHAEIALNNGFRIFIPRNKVTEFKKVYFSYYFDG